MFSRSRAGRSLVTIPAGHTLPHSLRLPLRLRPPRSLPLSPPLPFFPPPFSPSPSLAFPRVLPLGDWLASFDGSGGGPASPFPFASPLRSPPGDCRDREREREDGERSFLPFLAPLEDEDLAGGETDRDRLSSFSLFSFTARSSRFPSERLLGGLSLLFFPFSSSRRLRLGEGLRRGERERLLGERDRRRAMGDRERERRRAGPAWPPPLPRSQRSEPVSSIRLVLPLILSLTSTTGTALGDLDGDSAINGDCLNVECLEMRERFLRKS